MRGVKAWALVVLLGGVLLAGCLDGDKADLPPADEARPRSTTTPGGDPLDPDADLAVTGRWLAPFDGEVPAVNMVLLHDGRVLYWSGVEANVTDGAGDVVFFDSHPTDGQSRILDLAGAFPSVSTPVNPAGSADDLFCSGATILPDGRVLVVGSSEWHDQPDTEPFLQGGTDTRLFDPATDTWTAGPDMLFGRWYPSAITLPDGDALAVSGIGSLTNPSEQWPQMERYDAANGTWTYVEGGDQLLPLYPRVTVLPGGPHKGELAYNTVGTLWGPFGEHPLQAQWSLQMVTSLAQPAWSQLGPSAFGARQHAASVMGVLDPRQGHAPRFTTFGGSLYQSLLATPFTEVDDWATSPPTNSMGSPLNHARWHLNGVLLPDDTVLAVGGGTYDNVIVHGAPNVAVLPAELYDPEEGTWTDLAPMQVPRMYHSTALLLPDGRVLAGGHVPLPNPSAVARDTVNPQVHETRLEVFEPPYLFRGERPVLVEVPAELAYGASFQFRVADAAKLQDLVLMHPGATTHAFDANQRGVRLEWSLAADGSVLAEAPPDAVVTPPGHYMLFALGEGDGGPVPSVAAWVHLT